MTKAPTPIAGIEAFKSDVDAWRRNIRQANLNTQTCLYKPSTHQRCFSHFDRKTQKRMPRGLKSATHGVFRPERTGLRKTPSSWLPANVPEKTILVPCKSDIEATEAPFSVGVYDLGMGL